MSKYKTIDIWDKYFGNKEEVYDYTGKLIKKSACGNPNSNYHPTIDHIRPLSSGGLDVIENIIICHKLTNKEKGDSFPHWYIGNIQYKAIRMHGKKNGYNVKKVNK